jgi:vanillate monooxygenase ferredoxin subunit
VDDETLEVRIARKRVEADGIVSFEMVRPDGEPLPEFAAGAHIDVHIPGGWVRQYSLCSQPWQTEQYQIAVLLDPDSRGGSEAMHRAVCEGDRIRISHPRNLFALASTPAPPLLVAGGIGVTPILCMAEQLSQARVTFEMHYFTRSRGRTAFLRRIEESAFASQVAFHFDDGPPEQQLELARLFASPDQHRRAYVCGPAGFLEASLQAAKQNGWPDDRVHFESFKPRAAIETSRGFEVQIASTGAVYLIPPDKTVAQVLAEHSVNIPLSCEQGVCGTCLTRVRAGTPDHRDFILTPEERARNDQFTPCCSRSLSPRLVLDL